MIGINCGGKASIDADIAGGGAGGGMGEDGAGGFSCVSCGDNVPIPEFAVATFTYNADAQTCGSSSPGRFWFHYDSVIPPPELHFDGAAHWLSNAKSGRILHNEFRSALDDFDLDSDQWVDVAMRAGGDGHGGAGDAIGTLHFRVDTVLGDGGSGGAGGAYSAQVSVCMAYK